jgi:DNA polymerase-3 subunit alpha
MFMGKTYTEYQHVLQQDAILAVRGRVSRRDDGLNLHAQSAFAPDVGSSTRRGRCRSRSPSSAPPSGP